LSIGKRLTQMLGVTINMTSAPGKGTSFELSVDTVEESVDADQKQAIKDRLLPSNSKKVLLIDDDSIVLDATHDLLSEWGCDVQCARDRTQAFELLKSGFRPDLLIVDHRLLNDSGLEVATEARSRFSLNTRVLVISGDTDLEVRKQVEVEGFVFLLKPLHGESFRRIALAE
jgi:CheY-like chemotaxis protein